MADDDIRVDDTPIVTWLRETIGNRLKLVRLIFQFDGTYKYGESTSITIEDGMKADLLQIDELLDFMARIDYEFGCSHNADDIADNKCKRFRDAYSFRLMAVRYGDSPGYHDNWKVDL